MNNDNRGYSDSNLISDKKNTSLDNFLDGVNDQLDSAFE